MANPARELAQLLESWRAERTTTPLAIRRKRAQEEGTSLAAQHDRAIALYSETLAWIERLANGGIEVDHFREATPEWQAALFSFNFAWSSNPHSPAGIDGSSQMRV
ncbi:hypothetical protein [Kytococcus aerolatus]|uniref:hypothetical protein n=1 Tax=Kytococcus aerolatus TaxID=592308 RepID=UPI001179FE8F|nr:hypothetical protein [Kytococcus aerolatus]